MTPVIVIVGRGSPNVMAYTAAAVASGHAGSWSLALQVGFASVFRILEPDQIMNNVPIVGGAPHILQLMARTATLDCIILFFRIIGCNSRAIEKLAALNAHNDNGHCGHEQNLAKSL